MKHIAYLCIFFLLSFLSCKEERSSDFRSQETTTDYILKAKEWTEVSARKLRGLEGMEDEKWIKEWNKAEVITEINGQKVVVVPALNRYISRINEKLQYEVYFLVRFEASDQVSGSEFLHTVEDNQKQSKVLLKELVSEKKGISIDNFSGQLLRQRGDGTGWVIGNSFKNGIKIGTSVLCRKKESGTQNKSLRAYSECWDWYYRVYDGNGVLIYEEFLYTSCEEDVAPPDDAGAGNGGGNGGGNTSGPSSEIISNFTDPCYSSVLNSLVTNSYNMHVVLQSILPNFNNYESLILTFINGSLGPSSLDANYIEMGMVGDAKKYQITLNDAALSGAGQEYIAVTILHEVLHAYFHASGIDIDHHTNMANLYVAPMAQSLVNLYGISLNVATALAWGGLYQTDAWSNLSSTDQNLYVSTNLYWKNTGNPKSEAPGTKCN